MPGIIFLPVGRFDKRSSSELLYWKQQKRGGEPLHLTSFLQEKQLTICLTGEIDHHSAREIMEVLAGKVESYLPAKCVLDFGEVSFMDSSGIAIVLFALRRMRELDGTLELRAIRTQPYRVMKASGLDKLIDLQRS